MFFTLTVPLGLTVRKPVWLAPFATISGFDTSNGGRYPSLIFLPQSALSHDPEPIFTEVT